MFRPEVPNKLAAWRMYKRLLSTILNVDMNSPLITRPHKSVLENPEYLSMLTKYIVPPTPIQEDIVESPHKKRKTNTNEAPSFRLIDAKTPPITKRL